MGNKTFGVKIDSKIDLTNENNVELLFFRLLFFNMFKMAFVIASLFPVELNVSKPPTQPLLHNQQCYHNQSAG